MNQDFGLTLTPANARRLMLFQKQFDLELPDMSELASQDMIGEDDFDQFVCPYTETRRTITQFLLDCGMRAVVPATYHPEFPLVSLLNTVRLSGSEAIIYTTRFEFWKNAMAGLHMQNKIRFYHKLSSEDIDKERENILIYDVMEIPRSMSMHRNIAAEFPRTIFYSLSLSDALPWPILAHALFPTMPSPLYPRMVHDIPEKWKDKSLSAFALYYNVCIFEDLVVKKECLDDKLLHSNIRLNRSLINIF